MKRRKWIFVGLFVVVAGIVSMIAHFNWQSTTQTQGYQAIQLIEKYEIIRDSVSWQKLLKTSDNGKNLTDVNQLNVYLQAINKHSSAVEIDKNAQSSTSIRNLPTAEVTRGFTIINVPSAFVLDSDDQFANEYLTELDHLIHQSSNNLVINLINNTGGFFEPMTLGVSSLVPDGIIFREIDKNKKSYPLKLVNGQLTGGIKSTRTKLMAKSQLKTTKISTKRKIAVLINGRTGSAAELTALALKNNPQVKFFGTNTAGFTSLNLGKILPDKNQQKAWWLNLTVGYVKAVDGKLYDNQSVSPDYQVSIADLSLNQPNLAMESNDELFKMLAAWFEA
ncbi:S41 family peptidase [Lapidilactobacillus wuchangensis]|uniref:S41 family peptidase n=1 Tax=Lapidilactobacillus wuchangensis TaxID=2486001 RepID=UPI000F78B728|nr:S41 family peptidase [Lapidilactobacillus wuchangensis]